MDIIIKAGNVGIDMESGDIEIKEVHPGVILKAMVNEIGMDSFMDRLCDNVTEAEFVEMTDWLKEKHDLVPDPA